MSHSHPREGDVVIISLVPVGISHQYLPLDIADIDITLETIPTEEVCFN